MVKIKILSWNEGFKKVEFTKFLAEEFGVGLLNAKKITDDILEGQVTYLDCSNDKAELILGKAQYFEITCEVIEIL